MYKILIIEDDREINRLICEYLPGLGYEPHAETDGMAGLKRLREREDVDLVLLDLMLPLKSGDRVLKELRAFSDVPVIVLSAKEMVQTKIDLIKAGADDYVTKPFDLDELAVRIEAVLKRCGRRLRRGEGPGEGHGEALGLPEILTYKNMRIDRTAKTVSVKGFRLELTAKEYAILELLLSNPTKLFSKANLYESVWEEAYYAEDNTLKVHISNIRNKIKKHDEEEYVETVWGMGYKLAQ